jgi:hypothetical protein
MRLKAHGLLSLLHTCHESNAQVMQYLQPYQHRVSNLVIWADLPQDVLSSTISEHGDGFSLINGASESPQVPAPVKTISVDKGFFAEGSTNPFEPSTDPTHTMFGMLSLLMQLREYTTVEEMLFVHVEWKQEVADLLNPNFLEEQIKCLHREARGLSTFWAGGQS